MPRISEAQWLEYFAFRHFPFDRLSAGHEGVTPTTFLASCFVEPENFDSILGRADSPSTAILFADKGVGKTACRIAVEYYCGQGLVPNMTTRAASYVLSVPHTSFETILESYTSTSTSPSLLLKTHVIEILKRAVSAMVDLCARNPKMQKGLRDLTQSDQMELRYLVSKYSNYLRPTQLALLGQFSLFSDLSQHPCPLDAGPLEYLTRLSHLLSQVGTPAIYITVDGIDEMPETTGNPILSYELLKPLLYSMRLMDSTPGLSFKFFLPNDLKSLLDQDLVFRRDRVFRIETLTWQDPQLIKILRNRMIAFSSDERAYTEMGFDAVCVPELRGQVEHTLLKWAKGNPRHLLLLCGMMINAHCKEGINNQADPYQLNKDDLTTATREFQAKILKIGRIASPGELRASTEVANRYIVRKMISQTSHKQIVRAWDQVLQRLVSIKFLFLQQEFSHKDKEILFMKLEREARILASLRHPHIGLVFDMVYEPLGIVMEWIEGVSLEHVILHEGVLPAHAMVSLGADLASALQYIHEQGIIHQDLKPSNVLLRDDSQSVVLIDFDIASAVRREAMEVNLRGTLGYLGTCHYSSPEQFQNLKLTPMSDMFSFGVLLYNLLTGEFPYPLGNDPSLYPYEEFPNIEQRGIPDALFEVIRLLIQTQPAQRLSAVEVLNIFNSLDLL